MSLYLANGFIHIVQIQGVSKTDVPKDLRYWPRTFMEVCRQLARQEGLKGVRVSKAEALYSYRNPYVRPQLPPDARESALQRIRRDMKLIYDTNAIALGFLPEDYWYRWDAQNHRRFGAR
jgi:hypothetical protein